MRRTASFLNGKNYPPGSRIAIWSANSKDWPIVDLSIMLSGHISVPIYPGQSVNSARYIFDHSETRLVFAGAFDQAANLRAALPDGMATVAILGCVANCDTSLKEIIANYQPFSESPIPNPEDIITLIYTSGTTGKPKGVMHMHMHQTPGHVAPEWTIENAMLTPTMKLKRNHIEDCYRDQIEQNLAGQRVAILQ